MYNTIVLNIILFIYLFIYLLLYLFIYKHVYFSDCIINSERRLGLRRKLAAGLPKFSELLASNTGDFPF